MVNNYRKRHGRRNRKLLNRIAVVVMVIGMIAISAILCADYLNQKEYMEWAKEVRVERESKEQAQKQELAEKEAEAGFYQKLTEGFDVNILIVGDNIGAGAGASDKAKTWIRMLQIYLQNTYGSNIHITNLSMGGGNSAYPAYVRIMMLDDEIDYDLAIICCGQYDTEDKFSTHYEAVIRAIRSKFAKCSVISILESSQREYTDKIRTIQLLCEYYGIPVADTIEAFHKSDKNYDELSKNNIYPNDLGQEIYFDTMKTIIDAGVSQNTVSDFNDLPSMKKKVEKYNDFKYYSANEFTREDDLTYILNLNVAGIMGIDYTYQSGKNTTEIYVDDELFADSTINFDYNYSQRYIHMVSEECSVKQEIKIKFATKKEAEGFRGIIFSGMKE